MIEKSPYDSSVNYRCFLPCEYCYGFYHKQELYKHVAKCHFKPENAVNHRRIQSHASMLLHNSPIACNELSAILSKMYVNDVSLCVQNDLLIIKYGNALCRQHFLNRSITLDSVSCGISFSLILFATIFKISHLIVNIAVVQDVFFFSL